MQQIKNYIGGELLEPVSKSYLDNYCPSTGKVYSHIPDSDAQDVEIAYKAAKQAFPIWSNTPKEIRSKYLLSIAALIEKNLDKLA